MIRALTVFAAVAVLSVPAVTAAQLPFECPARRGESICPVLNPDNGHYYSMVDDHWPLSWSEAREATLRSSFRGLEGHLVTITSAAEHDFLARHDMNRGWIGASDRDVEGEWRWVEGPEAGTLFWMGGTDGTEIGFSAWRSNSEPNDSGPGEDYAEFGWTWGWNDLPDHSEFSPALYVIEFTPVPEPSGFALAAFGVLGFAGVLRRLRRR